MFLSRKTVPTAVADVDRQPRTVPSLAEVHPPFGVLAQRVADLQVELTGLDKERSRLMAQPVQLEVRPDQDQLKAVMSGLPAPTAEPVRDILGGIEDRRRLVKQAIDLLIIERNEEYRRASLKVCDRFADERRTLTVQMYEGLAAAAAARVQLGLLALEIERAGASADGFDLPLFDMFGPALARNSEISIELKRGIANGYLPESALPGELR
ncbi:hypothetical protein [Mesorhizobium sp. M4B.F.Ca.ET.013.02.1.1]|uniref:hypothetical protein n=1 Tax=Mesorhizobium sp. M4B.F.Ca.ET.013.02.1.1 TaxID=2496755 RepID=UPI000FD600D2|nr:hypothetical protein [Mesorhizobium sp. M4B.F.Ca.ET.013.02.1.1]RUW17378.1 hypothetical protein EOA34_34180 [Mesorhizobium sp. M4B.F.Ca.ET.013.02.1.1]